MTETLWARRCPAAGLLPLVAALALSMMAGCSMIPVYERPVAPVAAAFPAIAPVPAAAFPGAAQEAGAGARAPAGADTSWKDYFFDARLVRLIALALAHNRDLRVAVLNVEQARAQFQIRRADELPTVNAAASATRQPSVVNGKLGNSFSVGLAVSSWEIDFFGRIASLKEQALAQYLATEEGHHAAQMSLVATVANGWLNLLADDELLALAAQTLATREDSLRLTRLRFDHGAASALDLRQAETLVESARATLAQWRRQRALDENALVLVLGQQLPPGLLQEGGASLSAWADFPQVPAGLPSDLLERRPDIRQAEQQLVAANANIGAARAAFFPRIALTATAGTASGQLSGLFKTGSWGFTLAPQMLLPIFDAGRNQAGLAQAQASREVAVAQYEKAIQSAFRDVADALAGQATLGEQLRAQRAQAEAESQRYQLSELRYRNGVASHLDVLDAQRSLFAVQQAVVQTRLAQLQSQVALYRALGGGWDHDAKISATRAP